MRAKSFVLFVCLAVSVPACRGETPAPTSIPIVVTEAAPVTETPVPPTPIVHNTVPGEFPEEPSGVVGDQDSSVTAEDNRAPGGDRFTYSRFERPFNSQTMDEYYAYLDIQEGFLFEDETWIYAVIKLKGDEASSELKGRYAVEIDHDLDGDGDWLILVSNPVSTDWTTDEVQAWFDTNDDVGGELPTMTDENPVPENGYETLAFDAGAGNDPDLAWARVAPDDPNTVHLAAKRDILQGSNRYLAGFWAGNEDLDPALFELSDNFTHEQAGAALVELDVFYPIKEISALDNTCRMAVGFQPKGNEPGLCPLPNAVEPEAPGDVGCPPEFLQCSRDPQTLQMICVCNKP